MLEQAGALQEIAEALIGFALARVARKQWIERGKDVGLGNVLAIQRVHALATMISTQHQVVATRRLADQRYLSQIRPRAAIRAAADAQVEGRLAQAMLFEQGMQCIKQSWQIALGFRHRQAAGGQRHAGERIEVQWRGPAVQIETML